MSETSDPIRILNLQIDGAECRIQGSAFCNQELMLALAEHGGFEIEIVAHACVGDKDYDDRTYRSRGIEVHRMPIAYEYEGEAPRPEYIEAMRIFVSELLTEKASVNQLPQVFIMGHECFTWLQDIGTAFDIPTLVHLRGTPTREIENGIYPPAETKAFVDNLLATDWIAPLSGHFFEQMKSLGANPDRMFTFFNGYEDERFVIKEPNPELRESLGIPADSRVVMAASIFLPVKRLQDLIQSADRVLGTFDDVVYVILGDGSEQELLEKYRSGSPYGNRILMPGRVSRDDMPDYLALGDICVCASQSEGLCRSTIEATACGQYLVMSRMPAGIERTANGTMGSNFTVGDPNDLADTLIEVLSMPVREFDAIRELGRTYSEEHYKRSEQTPKYAEFLRAIIADHER